MYKYDTFLKYYLGIIILFLMFHYTVWDKFTSKIFNLSENEMVGDLGRMSYIVDSLTNRTNLQKPNKLIRGDEFRGQKIEMITVGTSFSRGAGGGENSFYQDYIANNSNINVLNVRPLENSIETIIILINSGFIDKYRPKYVLLESIERQCVPGFSKKIDFDLSMDIKKLLYIIREKKDADPKLNLKFINFNNYNALIYHVLYYFSNNAYYSKVFQLNLDQDFFSVKNSAKLLFYHEDIVNLKLSTNESIQQLNNNLNLLAMTLEEKGCKLIFMPIPDKYTLYSEFIKNNPYHKSEFFELLRPLHKDYLFIDTKDILLTALRNGEKDIYYSDDTHWSWKAPKIIFSKIIL